jgi:hypothetical protein
MDFICEVSCLTSFTLNKTIRYGNEKNTIIRVYRMIFISVSFTKGLKKFSLAKTTIIIIREMRIKIEIIRIEKAKILKKSKENKEISEEIKIRTLIIKHIKEMIPRKTEREKEIILSI